jgi:hypothetical protein
MFKNGPLVPRCKYTSKLRNFRQRDHIIPYPDNYVGDPAALLLFLFLIVSFIHGDGQTEIVGTAC